MCITIYGVEQRAFNVTAYVHEHNVDLFEIVDNYENIAITRDYIIYTAVAITQHICIVLDQIDVLILCTDRRIRSRLILHRLLV